MFSSASRKYICKFQGQTSTKLVNSFGTYKSSTGLVGLAVDPDGKNTLIKLSDQVLNSVKKIPETAAYRVNVEQWFTFIKKAASSHEDFKAIEEEINLGQIEEVIEMAKTELELIDFYYDEKVWELVEEEKKVAEAMVEDMAESIFFTSSPDKTKTTIFTPTGTITKKLTEARTPLNANVPLAFVNYVLEERMLGFIAPRLRQRDVVPAAQPVPPGRQLRRPLGQLHIIYFERQSMIQPNRPRPHCLANNRVGGIGF